MRLKETIQNNQDTLKTKFLRDLMYGILSKQQAEEQIDQYDLKQFQGSNTIIILQYMIDPELKENISAEGAFAIKKQIFSWVQHDLKGKVKAEMFELDDKRSILIIPEKDVDRIKRELNEMLLRAEELFAMNIIAVIGTPVDSIYQISDSFRSALNLLEYQFIWENHLIIIDDLKFKNEMYYYPLIWKE